MSFVAVITGVSGLDFYLDRDGKERSDAKQAKPFRSPDSATAAAKAHLGLVPAACARYMSYRVEPRT